MISLPADEAQSFVKYPFEIELRFSYCSAIKHRFLDGNRNSNKNELGVRASGADVATVAVQHTRARAADQTAIHNRGDFRRAHPKAV